MRKQPDEVVRPAAYEDLVDLRQASPEADLVRWIYGTGHDRYCNYRPEVTPRGYIYCLTCGQQIGCIHPEHHQTAGAL